MAIEAMPTKYFFFLKKKTKNLNLLLLFYSLIIHFSYADYEESRKKIQEARNIYETLLSNCEKDREILQQEIDKEKKLKEKEEKDNKEKDNKEPKEKDIEETNDKITSLEEELKKKLDCEALIYVNFMRFSRRSEVFIFIILLFYYLLFIKKIYVMIFSMNLP